MDGLLKSVFLVALGAAGCYFYISNKDKKNPDAALEEALEAELAAREARQVLPLQASHGYHHQLTHGLY